MQCCQAHENGCRAKQDKELREEVAQRRASLKKHKEETGEGEDSSGGGDEHSLCTGSLFRLSALGFALACALDLLGVEK